MVTSATSPTAGESSATSRTSSSAPAATPPTEPTKAKAEVLDDTEPTHKIKYTGPSVHDRIIEKADFKEAGSSLDEDVRWYQGNRHTVVGRFDEAAIALIKDQEGFRVTDLQASDTDES